MKLAGCLMLLFFVLQPVCAQDQSPDGLCRVTTKYDRFAEVTTAQCEVIDLGEAPARLTVQANVSFSRSARKPGQETFWLYLSSNRARATRRTRPMFHAAHTFCLSLDAVQLELPVQGYRNDYYELIPAYAESARVELSREELRRLLAAEQLTGCWGEVEFSFSAKALASLKDFISRQVFAAHTP